FTLSDKHDLETFSNYKRSDHTRHMRHGISYELDYDYNFHKNFAFGIVFSMYNAFDSYYKDATHEETLSDDKYIFYIGPSFLAHTNLIDHKWYLYGRATIGYMNFRNAVRTLKGSSSVSDTYKRGTFGYGLELGAEYVCNRYLSLNGQINFMGGSIDKVKGNETEIDLSETENLTRLGLALGVKIKL
ncbi:MAG: outer membrane beta-barrel protein, partial [Bacteroidota bacterium]|nr:outer membrane beta-barrel protein [Bacteroidota bacterium]